MEQEIDKRIGAPSAVTRTLKHSDDVNIPVDLCSNSHLWSRALCSDRKNEPKNTIGRNEFPLLGGWAQP